MKNKKAVIIGGTGFIGEYLVKDLSKNKDFELAVLYRTNIPQKTLKDVTYLQIDGSKDGKKLGEIIKGIDYLFILVQPDVDLIKNIIRYGSTVKKIIYTSTMLLYADSDKPHKENSKIKAITDYEKNKLNEEKLLCKFANSSNLKLCIARLGNVYGDSKNKGLIQKMFNSIMSDDVFTLNGDGEQKRDYVYVTDVASLLNKLASYKQNNSIEIYNICTNSGFTIKEIRNLLEKISNKKLKVRYNPPIEEKKYLLGNNEKIMKIIKDYKFIPLKSGLQKTFRKVT